MAELICFRTLGSVELTRGSKSLPLVRRRRRLALFAFVALSRPSFQSRDILRATFWPEFDQEHGRHALNSALYTLRRGLGANIVVSRGTDEVGIASDRVWCDVKQFDEAVLTEDYATALRLYGGELMPGFYIQDAPDFERWLDEERTRLHRAAHGAAWKRAERAEQAGHRTEAAEWARRAVMMSLDDEIVVQRSIRILDRLGDRVGAMAVYERFARYLEEEYGSEPAPETLRLLAGVRARAEPIAADRPSGQPPAPVIPDNAIPPPRQSPAPPPTGRDPPPRAMPDEPPATPEAVPARASRRSRFRRPSRAARVGFVAATLVAITGAVIWIAQQAQLGSPSSAQSDERPAILVSEFESLGASPGLEYLAPAITAAVTQQLAQVGALEVRADTRRLPGANAWSADTTAGRQFFLVRGTVLSSTERIRVGIELVDAPSGRILQTRTLERETGNIFELIDEIGRELGGLLRSELGSEIRLRRWRAGTANVAAWNLLQRAEVERQAAKTLEQTGSIVAAAEQLEKADSLVMLAEAADPEWIEPLVWRARVASDAAWLYLLPPLQDTARAREWIELGIMHADRALERDPRHAAALELRGTLLYWSSLKVLSRQEDPEVILRRAEADLRAAVSIDPQLPRAWNLLSILHYARGDFANAFWAARHAYSADAYLEAREEILVRLSLAAHEIGIDSLAWQWCAAVDPDSPSGAYCRLTLLSWAEPRSIMPPPDPWAVVNRASRQAAITGSMRAALELLTATVLARRGLADSARAVMSRVDRTQPGGDELLLLGAGALVALGEPDSAAALLRRYVTADPAHRRGVVRTRRFAGLQHLLSDFYREEPTSSGAGR